jgi:hypothetical protein
MPLEPIVKSPRDWKVVPNLKDHERVRTTFSWDQARQELDGLPGGQGLNIAHEAVDRHAAGPRSDRVAIRWISKTGVSQDFTYAQLRDLVNRARAGSLRSSELSDPTITVTSLGEQGVETVFGIIYPPQVAIVGFGKLAERPWSVDGVVVSRPVMTATLSADHRASDGHRGGLFLGAIDRLLQEPARL